MTDAKIIAGIQREARWPAVCLLAALIALVPLGVCRADVLNASFESTYAGLPWPRPLPLYWGHLDHPSFNSYCTTQWKTDGTESASLVNRVGKTVSRGNYQNFNQYVDLTGIRCIKFDVSLAVIPAGPFEHFEASFLVDGVSRWSKNTAGVYLDQQVNVADLAGWHRIELRETAVDAGIFSVCYSVLWDHVQLEKKPTTIPAVITLDPNTLNPASNGTWITCTIELGATYDVNQIDGATVTLNDVPAYMGNQGWATPESNSGNVADYDSDGVVERMVKFERAAVQAAVKAPEATVMVKGRLASGTPFEGTAVLRVLDKEVKGK